jgi:type I restriction enzyme M protein
MNPKEDGGSRIGIILNGSPLFTGGAGSGESEIRRYILQNDLLEALIAMPTDMFFNTGISTYIWILSNHKEEHRKNKVQLINASSMGESMRKSLGSKRKQLNQTQSDEIVRIYGEFISSNESKIFNTTEFGYRRITVERPLQLSYFTKDEIKIEALKNDSAFDKLDIETQKEILEALKTMDEKIPSQKQFEKQINTKVTSKLTASNLKLLQKHLSEHDEEAELIKDAKGKLVANADLRDYENVPLNQDINEYFQKEVIPHVPQAWIDTSKTDSKDGLVGIVGYEIPFNRHFYEYVPPRELSVIDEELETLTKEILEILHEV